MSPSPTSGERAPMTSNSAQKIPSSKKPSPPVFGSLDLRQVDGRQRGDRQQGGPCQRPPADRRRAEVAETPATHIRAHRPKLDQRASCDKEQQARSEPDARRYRHSADPASGDDQSEAEAALDSAHGQRQGHAQIQREQGRRAQARTGRTAARRTRASLVVQPPRSMTASSGICTSRMACSTVTLIGQS